MAKRKKGTIWYVQPLDAYTNEVIAKELAKTADVVETIQLEVKGKMVKSLYLVPGYHVISQLYSGMAYGYKFKVYRQVGSYGAVDQWKFGDANQKKAKKAKEKASAL